MEELFGKYRILKLLANGKGGEVYLAEHRVLGEQRIIKRLLKNRPFYEERKKEAHTLKCLHHSAIPRIYDIEEDATACYIIEEDMGGETLHDFLFRQKCLPTSFISHYSIQLCEVIEYLHRNGILHLDVKPENIMICGDKLSLVDFGGAIQMKEGSGVMFGTRGYAAPEQYNGEAEERSDVYGIGCVLGVMLGEEKNGRNALYRVYERCVQELPSKRYPCVSALKDELKKLSDATKKRKTEVVMKAPKVIGVIGVHEGAESTALCVLLAVHLNERGKGRVACIDLSCRQLFRHLYEGIFGTKNPPPPTFWLQGVCYVTEGKLSEIGSYLAGGFTTVILNFDKLQESYRDEFFRCDSRFALGALYPWRRHDWQELKYTLRGMRLHQDLTAVITGGERQLLPFRVRKVIELPFLEDVLCFGRKTEKVVRQMF